MTEAEWMVCTDLERMEKVVQGRISERKLILFGCACCYRQWGVIPDGCCKNAVETAEHFADGLCSATELCQAREQVKEENPNLFWTAEFECHAESASYFAAFDTVAAREMETEHPLSEPGDYLTFLKFYFVATNMACASTTKESPTWNADCERETAVQCAILRDMVGNPSRSIRISAAWLSWNERTVRKLAQVIYDERCFQDLPILADALEEAGCTNADILDHCRQPGEHVRGCWVIDLILDKE